MSAIRRTISRSIWRNANSSPYSRPATPTRTAATTESTWSVLGYIHDLFTTRRTKSPSPEDDEEEVHDDPMQIREEEPESPTQQATPPITPPQPTHEEPRTPTTSTSVFDTHALALNTTPSKHQELVTQYLLDKEREGKTLNSVEVEGLIALLNKAKDDEVEPEQFRFSTTPTTPTRSPQPPAASSSIFSFSPASSHTKKPNSLPISSSLPTFTNAAASTSTSTASPRKVLTRNPNGEYRWIGGGSARRGSPARGRSASPAKSQQHSLSLIQATPKSADTKRRRVGADRESSIAESSGPRSGSLPSASGVNGVANSINSGVNGKEPVTPTPKFARPLRPSLNPRTAPAHPSPLRQSFAPSSNPSTPGSSPSSSTGGSPRRAGAGGQSTTTTTTRAADVLSEIIEKVDRDIPKRVAQVANPYQTASPVKPVVKTKEVRRRTRASVKKDGEGGKEKDGKDGKDGKEGKGKGREDMDVDKRKDEEMPSPSPRAIIEATVPKGAKRSRPPAGLAKSPSQESSNGASPGLRRSARLTSASPEPETAPTAAAANSKNKNKFSAFTVEEQEEDADGEEDEDEDVSPTKRQRKVNGVADLDGRGKSLEVVEIDDGDVDMGGVVGYTRPSEVVEPREASAPPAQQNYEQPISVFTSTSSSTSPFGTTASTTTTTTTTSATTTAKSPTTSVFGGAFPLKSSAPKEPSKLRASYTAVEDEDTSGTSTPVPAATDFTTDFTPTSDFKDVPTKENENKRSTPTPTPTPKVNGFPSAPPKDPKEAAKALPVSALPTFAFAFEVAGTLRDVNNVLGNARDKARMVDVKELPSFDFMKPVSVSVPESRKTATATMTGTSTFPSPGLSTAAVAGILPKAEIKAFDFGAAGMKQPTKGADGKTWKCGTCDLMNPDSAQEKCTVCETPRPGGVSSTSGSAPAATPPAAPSPFAAFGGFGSAGAGGGGGGGGTGMGTFKKVDWSAMGVPSQLNGAQRAGSESSFTSASSTSVSVFPTPTPTPGATSTPVKAFDWVAAGLAPKVTTGNEWKCQMCDLQNAETVTEKCQYCKAPKE